MALEIERKYLEVDFDSLRRRLRQCGAQGGDVHLERNRIYDLPDGSLRAGHHLLRLRSQEWPDHAQNVLTLKLPPVSAPDAAFKVREERETPVTDAAQMHGIASHFHGLAALELEADALRPVEADDDRVPAGLGSDVLGGGGGGGKLSGRRSHDVRRLAAGLGGGSLARSGSHKIFSCGNDGIAASIAQAGEAVAQSSSMVR